MRKNRAGEGLSGIRILALDDDPTITLTIQSYFKSSGYAVDVESDPYAAIEKVRVGNYDIMLLDFLMTPICGDEVVSAIRKFNRDLFIILLTGHKSLAPPIKTIRELNIQGYFEKSERFDQLEMLVESCVKSIHQIATIRDYQRDLEAANTQLNEANRMLRESYRDMVNALRSTVDARDIYTRGHSDRVALLAEKLSRLAGRTEEDHERIRVAGLFHDIGKIRIPDAILLKEGRLTEDEMKEMRRHPIYAVDIMGSVSFFGNILPAVRGHHERYDGRGYPDGLAGEQISEDARMICLADSFDAMTSHRRYRNNMSLDEAAAELLRNSGTQFDPQLTRLFVSILENFDELLAEPAWVYPNID